MTPPLHHTTRRRTPHRVSPRSIPAGAKLATLMVTLLTACAGSDTPSEASTAPVATTSPALTPPTSPEPIPDAIEPASTTDEPASSVAPHDRSEELRGTPLAERASVRLINLSEDQSDLQLCVDSRPVADSIGYGDVTTHHPAALTSTISVASNGACEDESPTAELAARAGSVWTAVVAGDVSSSDAIITLAHDDVSGPAAGFVRVRALHSDPEAGPIDIGRFFEDREVIRIFRGLEFGKTAVASDGTDFDLATGYADLPPAPGDEGDFGALRAGSDHRIVELTGIEFLVDRTYTVYPSGSVVSGEPPASAFVCDDTEASETRTADCTLNAVIVVGDPTF